MRNLNPPNMKKLLLLPLLVVVCLVGDTSVRAIATAATTVTESTFANISTRAFVQTGDNVVIGGFIVERAQPTKPAKPKRVIIRAIGPELTQYGIPNALANPTLELHDGTGALIASNNNWATTIIGGIITASQVHEIQVSGYAPGDPFESAIIADLPAGSYTAIVRGINNMTGVALVEVYDLSPETSSILGNLSTRSFVQTGDNVMIGGFTIPGTKPKGIILRAIGPELSKYGIPNTLSDPTLELYDSAGALIASNDSWQHTALGGIIAADQVGDILNSDLAPGDRNESAINATLPPGNYTAIVRGVNNTTGVALLEGRRASATYTWTGAVDSHWENPANWEPNGVPEKGDTAAIPSGTSNSPTISDREIKGVQIALGNSGGGLVTLGAASVDFTGAGLTVTGGTPGASTVNATLSCQGNVSFVLAGQKEEQEGVNETILVEAGCALTIDAGEGTFTLTGSDVKTDIEATDELGTATPAATATCTPPVLTRKTAVKALVTQESSLFFKGRKIVTEEFHVENRCGEIKQIITPVIEIEGAVDIAEEVTLGGRGSLSIESGGYLSIKGTVESDEHIDFADGTGRISISHPGKFHGTVGFTPVAGARIDFPGIQAQSVGVQLSDKDKVYLLKLFAEPNRTGPLGEIHVQTIVDASTGLFPSHLPLTRNDFALSSDGKGGTRVTYLPGGTTNLEQSMPVPLIAPTGSKVSLQTIFSQSFGTSTPGFHSITLVSPKPQTNTPKDYKYWINVLPHRRWRSLAVTPEWFVNDEPIPPNEPQIVVNEKDYDNVKVELLVGNNIVNPAQFKAQVTRASSGRESETVTYSVWTVDPRVASGVVSTPGKPTPADIVAAAHSLDRTFPDVPNTNSCNWIADNVAAAAGASQPLPNFYPDPTDNVEGGFWRFAYTGARPNPVKNWFRLLLPGDIVRMQHDWGEGHTTTALSRQHPDGKVTVYSNSLARFISIHESTAEIGTNPASITIYRLDPKQQYLILGTSLGEVIQGSVYNNLIRPGGGADVIIAGPNNNEIQDITSNLNGITVRNFHPDSGDILNFTDLDPQGTTTQYDATTGILSVSNNGQQVATITIPGLNAHVHFLVRSNPGGGSNIVF
jgi:hypothetical protein